MIKAESNLNSGVSYLITTLSQIWHKQRPNFHLRLTYIYGMWLDNAQDFSYIATSRYSGHGIMISKMT